MKDSLETKFTRGNPDRCHFHFLGSMGARLASLACSSGSQKEKTKNRGNPNWAHYVNLKGITLSLQPEAIYPPGLWPHNALDPYQCYYTWRGERVGSKHPLDVEMFHQLGERNYFCSFICRRHCGRMFYATGKSSHTSLKYVFYLQFQC